ncbi:MAG: DNA translocase FtsK [Bacteroides sp.]|nr:DNA translocase FtsK [Bacteroides sp.]
MWNKVKNIFGKQTKITSSEPIKQEIDGTFAGSKDAYAQNQEQASETYQCNVSEIELEQMPLASALYRLRKEYGNDFMLSKAVLNALCDYKAFDGCQPARAIFRFLYTEGIYCDFINLPISSNWINEIKKISNRLSNKFGYKEELIDRVLANILLGFGKCSTSDIYSFIIEEVSVIETEAPNNQDAPTAIPPLPDKYKLPNNSYSLPNTGILIERGLSTPDIDSLKPTAERVEWVLNGYGVDGKVVNIIPGPRYSLYEIQVESKKLSKLTRNEKDILIALGSRGCRIINPLPNKLAIGIEIPNPIEDNNIMPGDIFNSKEFNMSNMKLSIAIGIDSASNVVFEDLAKLGNMLICGGLEQGKTTLIYQIIASLLFKVSPDDLKFLIAHSNQLELRELNNLPRAYFARATDVSDLITDRPDLSHTFVCLTEEMERRIKLLHLAGARSIEEYNNLFVNKTLNPDDEHHYLPRLVCIVDEIQPFFYGKEWDDTLSQMFEKAKGIGVHFIFTTRYTSTDSLTPLIRSYLTNKICFKINLPHESRLAIGKTDAMNLLDMGDVLVIKDGGVVRCQTSNFETKHFEIIVNELGRRNIYGNEYILPDQEIFEAIEHTKLPIFDKDPLFDEVARLVVTSYTASTSSIQRRYSIGYNRAGLIMDQLEAAGIVGPSNGGRPRAVLVDSITLESILNAL